MDWQPPAAGARAYGAPARIRADAEFTQVTHEVVTLRVRGGSDDVYRLLEQEILAAAPDVLRIEFDNADAPRNNLLSLPLVGEK